jgi:hypothetical protein
MHVWDGEKWVIDIEKLKEKKRAEIAAARYEAEIGGMEFAGMTVATDRQSQGLITGATLKAVQDETYTCRWKTAAGFVTLDAATVQAVADAVRVHVQTQFDREDTLAGQIDAAETVDEVREIGW